MADVTVTPKNVKPLNGNGSGGQVPGCWPYTLSAAANVGDAVYVSGNDTVAPTDADSAGTAAGIGYIVAIGTEGNLVGASGDRVSVLKIGRMAGFSGATAGALAYASGTTGKTADAAGTTSRVLGRFESATVLYVNPPA
jgi:hypothetical protein